MAGPRRALKGAEAVVALHPALGLEYYFFRETRV